jgi:hypothetical protein
MSTRPDPGAKKQGKREKHEHGKEYKKERKKE